MNPNDRAVPFSLSLPLSQIQRLERVLAVASAQGMLVSPPSRPNKLAAELLMQHVLRMEKEFRAVGLLPPEEPVAPGALPASAPVALDATRLATDPEARAKARANAGFGATPTPAAGQEGDTPLPEPPGIDWETVR